MSGFVVAPGELEGAAAALGAMGADAAALGGGGALGCGGLSGALEVFCSRAHAATAGLHEAGIAVGGGLSGGAAGYERVDRAAMRGGG